MRGAWRRGRLEDGAAGVLLAAWMAVRAAASAAQAFNAGGW